MQSGFHKYLKKWVKEYKKEVAQLSVPTKASLMMFLDVNDGDPDSSGKDIIRITSDKISLPICKFVHDRIKTDACDLYHGKSAQKVFNGDENAKREPCLFGLYGVKDVLDYKNIRVVIMGVFGLEDKDENDHFNAIADTLLDQDPQFDLKLYEEELKGAIANTPKVRPGDLRQTEDLIFLTMGMIVKNAYKSYELEKSRKDFERKEQELCIIRDIEQKRSVDLPAVLYMIVKRSAEYFHAVSCSIFLVNEMDNKLVLAASTNLAKEQNETLSYDKGEGLTGWVWQHNEPLLVNDVRDPYELKKYGDGLYWSGKTENIKKVQDVEGRKTIVAPLTIENRVIGVIRIVRSIDNVNFTEDDYKSLDKFVLHISNVIYNTRRYRKLNELIQELSLNRKGLDVSLEYVTKVVVDELLSDNCSIYLFHRDRKKLILTACKNEKKKRDFALQYDSLAEEIFRKGESLTLPESLPDFKDKRDRNVVLGVPIKTENRVIGVVIVERSNIELKEACYSDDDKTWLQILAGELAVIVEIFKRSNEIDALRADALITESLSNIGLMASGISHRFGNYIGTLRGALANIKKNIDNKSFIKEKITVIENKFNDMSKIIDELNFSSKRMMEKDSHLDMNINKVLMEVINKFGDDFDNNKVRVEKKLDANLPILNISYTRIQNVFDNLVKNALDAMPHGGRLIINSYFLDNCVKIEIGDTGEGIPAEIRDHIFTPFFTTKEEQHGTGKKGTGLGLFLCHKIMNDSGGNIELKESDGDGSTFLITLPADRKQDMSVYKGQDVDLFTNFYENMYKCCDNESSKLQGHLKNKITIQMKGSLDRAEKIVNGYYRKCAKELSKPMEIAKQILERGNFLINGKFDKKKLSLLYHNNEIIDVIVNEVYEKTGKHIFFTIFRATSIENSAVRIATNVPDANGDRALDTRISAAVYDEIVVRGKSNFYGRSWVVMAYYLSVYERITDKDDSNNAPLVLYVGLKEEQELLDGLARKLAKIKLNGEGDVDILTSSGKVVIHPHLYRGFDLSIDDFFEKKKDEKLLQCYWKVPGQKEYVEIVSLSKCFPHWKWIISVMAPLQKLIAENKNQALCYEKKERIDN